MQDNNTIPSIVHVTLQCRSFLDLERALSADASATGPQHVLPRQKKYMRTQTTFSFRNCYIMKKKAHWKKIEMEMLVDKKESEESQVYATIIHNIM